MKTIIYRNGGEIYLGEHNIQNLSYWLYTGRIKNQKWLYKGYRYFKNKKDIVVVFDIVKWAIKEKTKRKKNGFLGIREYKI